MGVLSCITGADIGGSELPYWGGYRGLRADKEQKQWRRVASKPHETYQIQFCSLCKLNFSSNNINGGR